MTDLDDKADITSAYPDEEQKLDEEFSEILDTWIEINQVLSTRNFELESYLLDGLPAVRLVRP